MKRTKRKKSGIGSKIRLGLLLAILATVCGLWLHTWLKQPYSAVAFVVCGKSQGIVVTLRNGTQEFYKAGDPEGFIVTKSIPDKRKGTLTAGGTYCEPARPQVF